MSELLKNRITNLKTYGVATPNKFMVNIFPPSNSYFNKNKSERVSLSCVTSGFPGKSFISSDRNYRGHKRKIPYGKIYEDNISLTFIVNTNMLEKIFFNAWQDLIVDNINHEYNFYDNYVSKINIYQLDKMLNPIYGITLSEAYPIAVSKLDLDVASNDSYHTLSVEFAYYEWKEILHSVATPPFSIEGFEKEVVDIITAGKDEINSSKFKKAINKMKAMKSKYDDAYNNAYHNYTGT